MRPDRVVRTAPVCVPSQIISLACNGYDPECSSPSETAVPVWPGLRLTLAMAAPICHASRLTNIRFRLDKP